MGRFLLQAVQRRTMYLELLGHLGHIIRGVGHEALGHNLFLVGELLGSATVPPSRPGRF